MSDNNKNKKNKLKRKTIINRVFAIIMLVATIAGVLVPILINVV